MRVTVCWQSAGRKRSKPLARRLVEGGVDREQRSGALSSEIVVRVFALEGTVRGYAVLVERQRHAPSFFVKCSQYGFSSREADVLELVIDGKNVREIASSLGIAEATVHCHLRNAGIKLGCTKRSAMIAKMLLR